MPCEDNACTAPRKDARHPTPQRQPLRNAVRRRRHAAPRDDNGRTVLREDDSRTSTVRQQREGDTTAVSRRWRAGGRGCSVVGSGSGGIARLSTVDLNEMNLIFYF
jgi:hypothetical protein